MLSKQDVDFIQTAREEIRINRMHLVDIHGEIVIEKHPVTGEEMVEEYSHEMDAVVTEVSVRTSVDRYRNDGIEIRTGDIIVDLSLIDVPEGVTSETILSVGYNGLNYTVVASDNLGLGGYNRIEVIGRRTQ